MKAIYLLIRLLLLNISFFDSEFRAILAQDA